ncbi:cytochrome c maturation protein CcmE [Phototrophicus methaneseepsis]|uniref:Cytochrome c maturation protein CcmE n=1 Tax=Phototrophicus methaneseepsis TaxID=2710758 RepID=A0A7S8IER3_9CHLR|nr:cytochrome c maturation protein CcmE [Phototrophicus methaneseepsis]QPC82078.1 cytochrome c maturation protein CcmE [Phototrophicus methaneseepsis]
MAEMTWEKSAIASTDTIKAKKSERLKFLAGGLLIVVAIVVLMASGTASGARYFISVDDVVNSPQYVGQTVRLTGSVFGETIRYNSDDGELSFSIANIPDDYEDLATALHEAVNNPLVTTLPIHMSDTTKPDLLQHEAQAILTGRMGEDGIFYATEVQLKCPSRFEEDTPGSMIHLQQG